MPYDVGTIAVAVNGEAVVVVPHVAENEPELTPRDRVFMEDDGAAIQLAKLVLNQILPGLECDAKLSTTWQVVHIAWSHFNLIDGDGTTLAYAVADFGRWEYRLGRPTTWYDLFGQALIGPELRTTVGLASNAALSVGKEVLDVAVDATINDGPPLSYTGTAVQAVTSGASSVASGVSTGAAALASGVSQTARGAWWTFQNASWVLPATVVAVVLYKVL